ncbi:MAG: VOC family protein [Yoonia sp.]|uniref:VOC family protein n=1 Tax=Yoonia sp. TaxID=2212373 RepID=UPI003267FD36
MIYQLDHIAIGCTDLAQGVAWAEERLGVKMQAGGQHAHFGTHNRLLGLDGGLYLEVIAKNPDASVDRPTWFDLDNFTGPPRLANWICRSDDVENAQAITGPPVSLTRDDLHWQLTVPDDGSLPMQGGYPSLLKWGAGITPPSGSLPASGVRLTKWEVWHPQADWLREAVTLDTDVVSFQSGLVGFKATFETPNGTVVL